MSRYMIRGSRKIEGSLRLHGAKNSVLPLIAACILTRDKVILHDCPLIADVDSMLQIMRSLGCKIQIEGRSIELDAAQVDSGEIPPSLAKALRSSVFLLGALLSRLKRARIAYPGGCEIGARPIDQHLCGLRALGVTAVEEDGMILCDSTNAKSAEFTLSMPSVGATENLIMASVFTRGETRLHNCATEPEIEDLQNFLNAMGARINGAGTECVTIEGVEKLHGAEWTPIPDRIVAGTYLIGTAMCGGKIELDHACARHLDALIGKLSQTSCNIRSFDDKIIIQASGRLSSVGLLETMYYPGFPTDLQTQMLALQCVSRGTSAIVENIFETRFKPVSQLRKMGADVTICDKVAIVRGVPYLEGASVRAEDLRGGASLVLAGLAAHGTTIVDGVRHIDRGYENLALELAALGADIERTGE